MIAMLVLVLAGTMAQRGTDPLTRARQAYNRHEYDQAVALAAEARRTPALADSASLVLSRALLARFRVAGDMADVAAARQAMLSVDGAKLLATERPELHLCMAELLFVDEQFGAAAELFETALDRPGMVPDTQRDRVLEWWAASLDRYAQLAPDGERQVRYRRLLTRLDSESRQSQLSAVVAYWRAAAARGADDLERAWSLAVAGWVQAPAIADDHGEKLRADLDRLMVDAIIPERARRASANADREAMTSALKDEWTALKKKWQ